jgi:hypothetical protein
LYYALQRNKHLAWGAGLYLGLETILRVPCFRGMAAGWKVASLIGTAFVYKTIFSAFNAYTYGPIVSAILRKHSQHAKADLFDITDRKREYYYIDTSSYMNYDF